MEIQLIVSSPTAAAALVEALVHERIAAVAPQAVPGLVIVDVTDPDQDLVARRLAARVDHPAARLRAA